MEYFAEQHDGHRARLRQRMQELGLDGIEPHETIEVLLCHVIPRRDVNDLAHALIERFGSVEGVLLADLPALNSVEGLGRQAAVWLALVGDMMLALLRMNHEERRRINCCLDMFRYACDIRDEVAPPCTLQVCLDEDNRLVYRRCIVPSRAWGEPACIREALSDMLESHAKSAVLVQYVGNMYPQSEKYDSDRAQAYADTLHAAGCALQDIVIVGEYDLVSMRQEDKIPEYAVGETLSRLREEYVRGMPAGSLRVQDYIKKNNPEVP